MFRQCLLPSAVQCLGIFAGYYLLCGPAPEPGGPDADVLPDSPEVAHRDKDNPDDTPARLQQRLMQADQERAGLAERPINGVRAQYFSMQADNVLRHSVLVLNKV